jgi:hypothetical protein
MRKFHLIVHLPKLLKRKRHIFDLAAFRQVTVIFGRTDNDY